MLASSLSTFCENDPLLPGATAYNWPEDLRGDSCRIASLKIVDDVLETLVNLRKQIAFLLGLLEFRLWNIHIISRIRDTLRYELRF
jgi:hypothetical protein